MSNIYVFGHKNPDTDTVCASIVYAKIKGYTPVILGNINKETEFALNRFNVATPIILDDVKNKKVVLVDHNEFCQSADNIEKAQILSIIDHHKINFKYDMPININTKPYGSTCTILAEMYMNKLDNTMAGLLLAGILSDTVIFKSPTTTEKDKEMATLLGQKININGIDAFGIELKNANASIENKTNKELIFSDFKDYNFYGYKVGIGQIELVTLDKITDEKKLDFYNDIKNYKNENNYDCIFFMITDIMKEGSLIIFEGDKNIIKEAFNISTDFKNTDLYLENVMSRKKQVSPNLENTYKKYEKK